LVRMRGDCLIGLGLAADIGTLVTVTHHAGSWTSGTFYAHHNHRGDIVLTGSGTATVSRYDYSAFGSLLGGAGPDLRRFQFSSKERDGSTGFYYGYRFYAPQWQRWVNKDPIAGDDETNEYRFAENSPVVFVDPLGLSVWSELKNLTAMVIARLARLLGDTMSVCPKKFCDSENKCRACCLGLAAGGFIANWLGAGFGAIFCSGLTHPVAIIACGGLVAWAHIEAQIQLGKAIMACLDQCARISK